MDNLPPVVRECIAAGVGCSIADGSLNALEVTKVKLQLDSIKSPIYPRYPPSLIRQVVAEDGMWRGLMEPGLGATILRGCTYVAFRIGLYSSVRDAITRGRPTTFSDQLLAGAVTGGLGSMLFCPIDVVRVRQQSDAGTVSKSTGLMKTGLRKGKIPRHKQTLSAFGEIVRSEGALGLYKGAQFTIVRAALLSASQLASYESLKGASREMLNLEKESTPLHLVCALTSGLIAQTCIMPFDTARSYFMAAESPTFSSLIALCQKEGAFNWAYRGYAAACARQGPIMLFQLPLIEKLRELLGVGYL